MKRVVEEARVVREEREGAPWVQRTRCGSRLVQRGTTRRSRSSYPQQSTCSFVSDGRYGLNAEYALQCLQRDADVNWENRADCRGAHEQELQSRVDLPPLTLVNVSIT